ncbi:MAG TPA: CopD family protein [Gemmatimonadales bacterium]
MFTLVLFLHVLGASVWAGGHLVLSITILPRALRARDPAIITAFEDGFEKLGIPALLIQVVTGFLLAQRLLPNHAQWFSFDGPVATHIGIKFILLLLTIMLAVHARVRLIPKLDAHTLPALAAHIVAVTVLAVLFLLVGIGFRTGGIL